MKLSDDERKLLQAILDGETIMVRDDLGEVFELKYLDRFALYLDNGNDIWAKEKTILVNNIEVPLPVQEPLTEGTKFFVAMVNCDFGFSWVDNLTFLRYLQSGLIHLKQESAQKHFEAIISTSKLKS